MGLDTTHDCFHGAYSRFHRFRNDIGIAAGFPTVKGPDGLTVLALPWDAVDEEVVIEGYWKGQPPDIIYVLLMHSDCEGFIMPRHCEPLADRLEQLLPELDNETSEQAQQFINGLRDAAEAWEFVQFH